MTQRLHVPVHLRWADLDAFGHVNNVQVARILEEARVRIFWTTGDADPMPTAVLDSGPTSDTWTLIARQELEYLQPMPYFKAPIDVQIWFSKLGGASIELCYEVFGPTQEPQGTQELYSRAMATLVLVDPTTGKPRRILPHELKVWELYLGEPISFRHSQRN